MATQTPHFPPMTMPPPSSSNLATFVKVKFKSKSIIHNFIFSYIHRTFTKVKSTIVDIIKETRLDHIKFFESLILKRNKDKAYFGSFRLHYNWCSSHVVPVTSPMMQGATNSHVDYEMVLGSQLTRYLRWLEEKDRGVGGVDEINEIDRLADRFIANSHEKFMLEKQESYRRFQEMMARSV